MAQIARVKTGIPGFDELIEGGVPQGFNVLVVGQPGTGKTIFGLQYLCNGAMAGENGIYVSLDSPNDLVKSQARQFGWDVDTLERDGKLMFLKIPLDKPKINLFDILEEEVKACNAKRLVFDSLADFAINIDQFVIPLSYTSGMPPIMGPDEKKHMETDKKYRYEVLPTLDQDPQGRIFYTGHSEKRVSYLTINELSKLGTTNLVITDAKQGGESLTVDGVSEYACDAVVTLHAIEGDEDLNTLNITKMRLTKVKRGIYNFNITKEGIVLKV